MTLTSADSPSTRPSDRSRADGPPTVLRCRDTADFLAALPHLTGFTAEDSLFIVLFSGVRAGRAIRIDLPPSDRLAETGALLDGVCRILSETGAGADGPALVITSTDSFAATGGAPWKRFARRLERRFTREGWRLREFACVAPDGWMSYLDPSAPSRGRPLSEIAHSPVAQHSALNEHAPTDLDRLGRFPEPNPALVREVSTAVAGSSAHELNEARRTKPSTLPADAEWVAETADLAYRACSESRQLPDALLCARLARAAEHPDRWLILALTSVTRPEFVVEMALTSGTRWYLDIPVSIRDASDPQARWDWSIEGVLLSLSYESPAIEKLERAIDGLGLVAAHVPEGMQSGLRALIAWLWWMKGMQSVATRITAEALAQAPEYELVAMIDRLCGSIPGWLLQPRDSS